MRLLLRLSLFVLLAGLLTGLALRHKLRHARLGILLTTASLPWLLHMLYVLTRVPYGRPGMTARAVIFVLFGLLAALASHTLSRKLASHQPESAALYPLLLGALYGLLPLLWFFYVLRGAGVLLDSVAHVWLAGGLLFETTALLGLLLGRDGKGRWALPRPFRRH